MNLYKAHIVHPMTQMPLIVYYNESAGMLNFEKDEDAIHFLTKINIDPESNEQLLRHFDQAAHICSAQYPLANFEEVYIFLDKIGITETELDFTQVYLH